MTKYFTNNFSVINLHKKQSVKSEIATQMIYGESFSISKKNNKWLKIKIREDGYKGFVQTKIFSNYLKPTHKICKLSANVFKFPNKKGKINKLTFGSKIRVIDKKNTLLKFANGWIDKKNLKLINYEEKNLFKNITIFKGVKYKWGGKSFMGIDCSALIQVCLNFNNKSCPRDTKDQVKYFKKNIKLSKIKKNDIIFWKGHVAVALSKNQLIHAYGPLKKTVIMGIDKTLKKIKKTANLSLKNIKIIK